MLIRASGALILLAFAANAQPALRTAPAPEKPSSRPSAARTLRVVTSAAEPLNKAALKATLGSGQTASVVRVRTAEDDLLLLLVADLTGDLTRIDAARGALSELLKNVPQNVWVGLLRAQDGPLVVTDPQPDREKVTTALLGLAVTGKSALLDTVEQVMRLADSVAVKTTARVAVLYITDSDIRNYREDFSNPVINSSDSRDLSRRFPEGLVRERIARLKKSIAAYQTPLYICHLQFSSDRLNEAYQSGLAELAGATGGVALFTRTLSDISDTVSRVLAVTRAHQQVVVQLPSKHPRELTLSLQTDGTALQHRTRFLLP